MKNGIISRNQLKYIAIISMIIDHIGYMFTLYGSEEFFISRMIIGRIAMPIFTMLLVEGYFRSRDKVKHVLPLLILALISQPIYFWMFGGVNIVWGWLLAWVMMYAFDEIINSKFSNILKVEICMLFTVLLAMLTTYSEVDYAYITIVSSSVGYFLLKYSKNKPYWLLALVPSLLEIYKHGYVFTLLSIPIVLLYNPDKKCYYSKWFKYLLYLIYPLHLIIIMLAAQLVY